MCVLVRINLCECECLILIIDVVPFTEKLKLVLSHLLLLHKKSDDKNLHH